MGFYGLLWVAGDCLVAIHQAPWLGRLLRFIPILLSKAWVVHVAVDVEVT